MASTTTCFSFDDEVVADTKIGKSFGLGTLDSQLRDLAIDVKDTLALDITNTALLDSLATAVTGDATAKGQMAGNTGIYQANLKAGGAGSICFRRPVGVLHLRRRP